MHAKVWWAVICACYMKVEKILANLNPKSSTPLNSSLWKKLPSNVVYSGQVLLSQLNTFQHRSEPNSLSLSPEAAVPPETPQQTFTVRQYYHKGAVILTINFVIN
jgi:hypothetical protein